MAACTRSPTFRCASRKAQFVAIVGPNGAGKTTLFKAISGTVTPVSGRISYRGQDLLAVPPAQRPHLGIAHVPEGRQVFASMTVLENLEMGAYLPAGRAAWRRSLERIFALFPVLAERRQQLAGTLSGGEQQMVAIGRGLALQPQAPAAGRAVDGAGAECGGHDLRVHRGDPPRGRGDHPAGRAARGGGAARPAISATCWRRVASCCRARATRCWRTTASGRRIWGCEIATQEDTVDTDASCRCADTTSPRRRSLPQARQGAPPAS